MLNRGQFIPPAGLGSLLAAAGRRTAVSIRGDAFLINGRPTYEGREYNGSKIEGLLMNSRVVQGIFDDSDRKSTRLNSSHLVISYAVFCLKKKKKKRNKDYA